MAKLIDREGVITDYLDRLYHGHKSGYKARFEALMGAVENAKVVDAEPQKHAHWVGIEYDGFADGFPVYDVWECSECGEEVSGEDVPTTYEWCFRCGAKMDEGGIDGD